MINNVKITKKVNIINILNNQKVFYILILLLLISYFSIFMFANSNDYEVNCDYYLVSYSEGLNLDEYIEKNPMSIRGDIALIELNLLPDLNSLRCLGKSIVYETNNIDTYQTFATSQKLLEIVIFLNTTVIFSLFHLFSSKTSKLQFFFINLISYFVISNLFFGSTVLNYYFVIYPLSIVWYIVLNSKNIKRFFREKILDIYIFINVNLLLINYDFYSLILPFLIIFYFFFIKQKVDIRQVNVISLGAIFYYFLRQLSGPLESMTYLWQNLSSGMFKGTPRFADMYYTFAVLNCNKTGCSTLNNYGPLWKYISIDLNVYIATYISSLILIFITQVFFYRVMKENISKSMLIFFVYISPPTAFLIERMNFDIFVIIFGYFALTKYSKGSKNLALFIITLLTLVKIFPIIFFIGIAIYEYLNKELKSFLKVMVLAVVNIIIYIFYFYLDLQTGVIAEPTGISWTFGVLTDLSNYSNFFGGFGYLLYFATLLVCLLIYIKFIKTNFTSNIFSSSEWLLEISFSLCFIFISMYYNFDFRISIFSIGLILIIKNYNLKSFEIISLLFLSTCVSNFYTLELKNTNPLDFYFSSLVLFVNQITFNLVIIFLIGQTINFIKTNNIFNFYKDSTKISKS